MPTIHARGSEILEAWVADLGGLGPEIFDAWYMLSIFVLPLLSQKNSRPGAERYIPCFWVKNSKIRFPDRKLENFVQNGQKSMKVNYN